MNGVDIYADFEAGPRSTTCALAFYVAGSTLREAGYNIAGKGDGESILESKNPSSNIRIAAISVSCGCRAGIAVPPARKCPVIRANTKSIAAVRVREGAVSHLALIPP